MLANYVVRSSFAFFTRSFVRSIATVWRDVCVFYLFECGWGIGGGVTFMERVDDSTTTTTTTKSVIEAVMIMIRVCLRK